MVNSISVRSGSNQFTPRKRRKGDPDMDWALTAMQNPSAVREFQRAFDEVAQQTPEINYTFLDPISQSTMGALEQARSEVISGLTSAGICSMSAPIRENQMRLDSIVTFLKTLADPEQFILEFNDKYDRVLRSASGASLSKSMQEFFSDPTIFMAPDLMYCLLGSHVVQAEDMAGFAYLDMVRTSAALRETYAFTQEESEDMANRLRKYISDRTYCLPAGIFTRDKRRFISIGELFIFVPVRKIDQRRVGDYVNALHSQAEIAAALLSQIRKTAPQPV